MGIFSRFENKMEDGIEGAAGKIFNAPISPVQISKKAEKAMKREKMVGAGKQYAPTLYTVLVNAEDDKALFGYYPTLAGETETFLSARAVEDGLMLDGQPLVRFIVDNNLKRGKFDVVAELVSAPIVAQLRREEMQRYGLLSKPAQAPSAAPAATEYQPAPAAPYEPASIPPSQAPQAPQVAPAAQVASAAQAPQALQVASAHAAQAAGAGAPFQPAAAQAMPDSALEEPAPAPVKKQPLPYVPEEEIDRTIDYGEYTFNSQDFEDYEEHGPSAQLIDPEVQHSRQVESLSSLDEDENLSADLSGFDVEAYNPYAFDSRNIEQSGKDGDPLYASPHAAPASAVAPAPAVNTQVFVGGGATPEPDASVVTARLINTSTNRDFNLVGGRLILGRSRSCDIVVDDINISRSHAELRREPQGAWILTDLGSTNGTKVNGQRITSYALSTGDHISLGATDLLFLEG